MPHHAALLFDLDGCIVDSLPTIIRCWSETLPEFGLAVPSAQEVRAHVGPPVGVAARSFAPDADDQTIAEIVADYRRRSAQAHDSHPFPGMMELITALHRADVRLGVATSKSEEVVMPLLERLGLASCFAVVEATRVDELDTDKAAIVGRAVASLAP